MKKLESPVELSPAHIVFIVLTVWLVFLLAGLVLIGYAFARLLLRVLSLPRRMLEKACR